MLSPHSSGSHSAPPMGGGTSERRLLAVQAVPCATPLRRGCCFSFDNLIGAGKQRWRHIGRVISTLVPSAAFGFALFLSVSNAGAAIGDNLAAVVERLSMTLFDLVKLLAAASAACCLFVFFLPCGLLNHWEGKQ